MPSTCPATENNLGSRRGQSSSRRARGGPRRRRLRPVANRGDEERDDDELLTWLGWFYRFHTDPPLYIPYALRTLDCTVELRQRQGAALTMRCVREVAKFNGVRAVEWLLITWVPRLPGVTFQHCESEQEAMALLDSAPARLRM
jgi:hypothetical protein